MTYPHKDALKAAIDADPALSALSGPDGAQRIADYFNAVDPKPVLCYRNQISLVEIKAAIDWDEVQALPAAQVSLFHLLLSDGVFDATVPSARTAINNIFADAAFAKTLTALKTIAVAAATRAEALGAVGDGTPMAPAIRSWQGKLTYQDVLEARANG